MNAEHSIVQQYIRHPYLIDSLKFDLRIYVLVTGTDPLRIYIHKQGLTRFATENYTTPNQSNSQCTCVHLTNYAINKGNPKFVYNSSGGEDNTGHKWSL